MQDLANIGYTRMVGLLITVYRNILCARVVDSLYPVTSANANRRVPALFPSPEMLLK